jgi:hypothetical protein
LLFVIIVTSSTLFLALTLGLLFLAFTFGFFGSFAFALSIFALFLFFLDSVIESLDIIGGLAASLCLLSLDPISTLLKHLFFDLVLLHVVNLFLNVSLGVDIVVHVRLLDLLALIHGLFSTINGFVLRFAAHAQENHLFLAKIIDAFTSQNTLEAFLNEKGSFVIQLISVFLLNKAILYLLEHLSLHLLLFIGFDDEKHTIAALTTTFVLLNQANSFVDVIDIHR